MHDSLDIVSLWAPHIPSLIESLHTEIETVYLPRLRAQEEMKPVGISVLHTQSVSTLFDICNQHVTLFKVCVHTRPPPPRSIVAKLLAAVSCCACAHQQEYSPGNNPVYAALIARRLITAPIFKFSCYQAGNGTLPS